MKRRPFVTSVLATSLVVLLFSGPLAWAGVDPTPFGTGLFGITAGQSIRVSFLNAGGEGGIINPCFNPGSLVAAVAIRDLGGAVLFRSRTKSVLDGAGTFVDVVPIPDDGRDPATVARLPSVPLSPTPSRRLQVRAEVVVSADSENAPLDADGAVRVLCGGVALTLEVFDVATGKTAFTMPFVKVAFNPQPEPPEPIAVP